MWLSQRTDIGSDRKSGGIEGGFLNCERAGMSPASVDEALEWIEHVTDMTHIATGCCRHTAAPAPDAPSQKQGVAHEKSTKRRREVLCPGSRGRGPSIAHFLKKEAVRGGCHPCHPAVPRFKNLRKIAGRHIPAAYVHHGPDQAPYHPMKEAVCAYFIGKQ